MSAEQVPAPVVGILRRSLFLLGLCLAGTAAASQPVSATLTIVDQAGQPLDRAVVTIAGPGIATSGGESAVLLVDQLQKRFVPDVIAIDKGDSVRFPNSDDIRHHVFSFSSPLIFELPLYSGEPRNPVHFPEAGLVVVGCNIHDRMKGYIYVVEDALHEVSTEGRVQFAGLPEADLVVTIHHPDAVSEPALQFTVPAAELAGAHQYVIELKPPVALDTSGMTELEKKFLELRHAH